MRIPFVPSLAVAILTLLPAAGLRGQEVTGASPASASLTAGGTAALVDLTGKGLDLATGAQVLKAGRPVTNVTAKIVKKGSTVATVELAAAGDAVVASDYTLALLASSKLFSTPVRIAVTSANLQISSVSPTSVSIEAGGAAKTFRLVGSSLEGLTSVVVQRGGMVVTGVTARFITTGSTQRDATVEASGCATPAGDYTLVASSSAARLTVPVAVTVVAPTTQPALVSLAVAPTTLEGGNGHTAQGTVQLDKAAPAAGVAVTLTHTGISPNVAIPESLTVTIGACQTSQSFTIRTQVVSSATTAIIGATLAGVSRTANLELQPPVPLLRNFTVSNNRLWGGGQVSTLVELDRLSPFDTPVQVTQIGLDTPRGVLVRANERSVLFPYDVLPVTEPTVATVTATLNGSSKQVTLTLDPTVRLEFGDLTIEGTATGLAVDSPRTVNATLALDHPAPPGGLRTRLSFQKADGSGPTGRLSNPTGQNPTVPEGQTSVTFPVGVFAGKDAENTSVIVEVSSSISGPGAIGSTANAFLNLAAMPHRFTSLTLDRTSIPGTGVVTATVTIEPPPPPFGDQRIHLVVRKPDGLLSLPPDQASRFSINNNSVFTFPGGQTTLTIPITVQPGSQPAFPVKFKASFATADGVGTILSQELVVEPSP